MTIVAVAHRNNIKDATLRVIELLGGMKKFVHEGQTVFIKPDLSTPIGSPASTDPLVIGTIAKLCFEAGAKKVFVGDNPFGGISSKALFKFTGLDDYLENLGVTVKYLEKEIYESKRVPNYKVLEEIELPKCVLDSDVLISIPTLRTDILSDVALSIKNLHGLLNDEQYYQIYKKRIHEGLIDILKVIKPNLVIMDSFISGEGQGPFKLSGIETQLSIGSIDPVAIDSIASILMGYEPFDIKNIKLAHDSNLGNGNTDKISIIGDELKKFDFKRAKLISDENKILKIHQKDCCEGCLASFRIFTDLMDIFLGKELEKYGGFTCLLGENSKEVFQTKGVILFGDCAIYPQISFDKKKKKKIRKSYRIQEIPGCPPVDLKIFEKIALNFKDKIPAFEFINEIIKRWTKGRKLKIPRHEKMREGYK